MESSPIFSLSAEKLEMKSSSGSSSAKKPQRALFRENPRSPPAQKKQKTSSHNSQKSPCTPPSNHNIRNTGDRAHDLAKSAEDLEDVSVALSAASRELLTPPPAYDSKQEAFVLETVEETQLNETQGLFDLEQQKKLAGIMDDVNVALVFATALKKQLVSIQKGLASKPEIKVFNAELEDKVKLVAMVAKKGVALEKVTEYRLVEKEGN